MDMLEWGANWLSEAAIDHASYSVTVIWRDQTYVLNASLVDEAGRTIPNAVKVQTEFTRFLFRTRDVTFEFQRGMKIVWQGNEYEVVLNGSRSWSYNDSHRKTIVVDTKHVSN